MIVTWHSPLPKYLAPHNDKKKLMTNPLGQASKALSATANWRHFLMPTTILPATHQSILLSSPKRKHVLSRLQWHFLLLKDRQTYVLSQIVHKLLEDILYMSSLQHAHFSWFKYSSMKMILTLCWAQNCWWVWRWRCSDFFCLVFVPAQYGSRSSTVWEVSRKLFAGSTWWRFSTYNFKRGRYWS